MIWRPILLLSNRLALSLRFSTGIVVRPEGNIDCDHMVHFEYPWQLARQGGHENG